MWIKWCWDGDRWMTIASKRIGALQGWEHLKRKQRAKANVSWVRGRVWGVLVQNASSNKRTGVWWCKVSSRGSWRDNRDVTVLHHNGAPVHGRYVVLRENMHKRLRHYEMHDDDGYEMLFTGYLGVDLYYVLTNPNKDVGSINHLIYSNIFVILSQEAQFRVQHQVCIGIDFCLPETWVIFCEERNLISFKAHPPEGNKLLF